MSVCWRSRIVVSLIVLVGFVPAAWAQLEVELAPAVVERSRNAHGVDLEAIESFQSISEGTITLFDTEGVKATFPVTVLRDGVNKVQRIVEQPTITLRHGTDGVDRWDAAGGMRTVADGPVHHFIESLTARSPRSLFDHARRNTTLRDAGVGVEAAVRRIEAEDAGGLVTVFSIDDATSTVAGLEFVTGELTDPFSGEPVPSTDRYVFSDYREVNGERTPFMIERYINGMKVEEVRFDSVRHDVSLSVDSFQP